MKNLLFLPIDIDIPILKFLELENVMSDVKGSSFWDYEQLLDTQSTDPYPWKNDLDNIRQTYKDIIMSLPFQSLENVRLSIQSKIVRPHIDVSEETKNLCLENYFNYVENEPSGYRIVISGNKSSLRLIVSGKMIATELPKIPCIYLINATSCRHFIHEDIGRKSIYIRGKIKHEEHMALIEKSFTRYKKLAIFS